MFGEASSFFFLGLSEKPSRVEEKEKNIFPRSWERRTCHHTWDVSPTWPLLTFVRTGIHHNTTHTHTCKEPHVIGVLSESFPPHADKLWRPFPIKQGCGPRKENFPGKARPRLTRGEIFHHTKSSSLELSSSFKRTRKFGCA